MILSVKENPAPVISKTTCSDLTGRKHHRRGANMVAFRSRRKRRAVRTNARRKSRRSAARKSVGVHRPRLTFKSGKWFGGHGSRSLIPAGSGTRINPFRRRRGRHVRRNPAIVGKLKNMFNRNLILSTAKAGAGIAIGFTAMPLLYKVLPSQLKDQRRWLGGIHVLLGLSLAGLIRNRNAKDIGLVIAATGMYDLIAMNVDFLGLPPLRTTSALADKLIPTAGAAAPAAPAEAAMGSYGSSYPVLGAPVSRVAAVGVGANFERVGASYPSLAYPTVGLSGDNGCEMGLDDLIN